MRDLCILANNNAPFNSWILPLKKIRLSFSEIPYFSVLLSQWFDGLDNYYEPNKEFISTCCLKYKFAQEQVEQYILKLFKAKTKVINECKKANLKMPNDAQLNHLILFYYGHWQTVLHNIREGL